MFQDSNEVLLILGCSSGVFHLELVSYTKKKKKRKETRKEKERKEKTKEKKKTKTTKEEEQQQQQQQQQQQLTFKLPSFNLMPVFLWTWSFTGWTVLGNGQVEINEWANANPVNMVNLL